MKPSEPVRTLPEVTALLQKVLPSATIPSATIASGSEFAGMVSVSWSSKDSQHNLHFDLQSSQAHPSEDSWHFNYAGKMVQDDHVKFFYLGKNRDVRRFVIDNNGRTLYYDLLLEGVDKQFVHLMVSGPEKAPDDAAVASFLKTLK